MTSGYYGHDPVLVPEEEGEHIVELQQVLAGQGQAVEVTGRFDDATQAALRYYGEANGLYGEAPEIVAHIQQNVAPMPLLATKFENAAAQYGHQGNVLPAYQGEEQAGNNVWFGRDRDQTYYPDQATADADYGTTLADGQLQYRDGEAVHTTDVETQAGLAGSKPQRMIYTMDGQGGMRVADPNAEQGDLAANERFHHSSLAGGEAVSGAGELRVNQGTVEAVSDKSGHYKPDFAMTSQVHDRLEDGGVDTSRVTYELGNFGQAGKGDTLVSGTEMGAYDRDGIVHDIASTVWQEAQASAERKFGRSSWAWLSPEQQRAQAELEYTPAMQQYQNLTDRELFAEGRKILEGRHDGLRAVLAQIPQAMGWREDPFGRHTWRWFDGTTWTEKIYDDRDGQQVQGTDAEPFGGAASGPGPQAAAPAAPAAQQDPQVQQAPAQGGGYYEEQPAAGGYVQGQQPAGGAAPLPQGGYVG